VDFVNLPVMPNATLSVRANRPLLVDAGGTLPVVQMRGTYPRDALG